LIIPMQKANNDDDNKDENSTFACTIRQRLSQQDGQKILNEILLPTREYGNRIRYGGKPPSQQQDVVTATTSSSSSSSSTIVKASDARTSYTYGEFPMSSLDDLMNLALTYYFHNNNNNNNKKRLTMIDVGSGCGRLVLYSALTRRGGSNNNNDDCCDTCWTCHGIEISNALHDEALRASLTGMDHGWFEFVDHDHDHDDDDDGELADVDDKQKNAFVLHRGFAEDFDDLFRRANIIFAYSTVFEAAGFSETLGAIVLNQKWNELFSKSCNPGTVVITTDRCLDPAFGWQLVDQLDVDNREVMGSTGYIHIFRPSSSSSSS